MPSMSTFKMNITQLLILMRPHQYLKNTFIFAPLFFSAKGSNPDLLLASGFAFIAFSLLASAIYIFNDYCDREEDRLHPQKQHRPLASKSVSATLALTTLIFLLVVAFLITFFLSLQAMLVMTIYVACNLSYSLWLKNIIILDIIIISLGFILRLYFGAYVCGIDLSIWIILLTGMLALLLSLTKRRDDVLIFQRTGRKMRTVVTHYKPQFLNIAIFSLCTSIIVTYLFYISVHYKLSEHIALIYPSTLFVMLGLFRYLYITYIKENSGSPTEVVLQDWILQMTIFAWLAYFSWVLYA